MKKLMTVVAALALALTLSLAGTARSQAQVDPKIAPRAVRSKKGGGPSPAMIAGMMAERARIRQVEYLTDTGTKYLFKGNPDADTERLHRRLARDLSALNLVPKSRSASFEWVRRSSIPGLRCKGCLACVEDVNPIFGGYRVLLSITPVLDVPEGGAISANTTQYETYVYVNGCWSWVESRASNVPRIITFN